MHTQHPFSHDLFSPIAALCHLADLGAEPFSRDARKQQQGKV